MIILKLIIESDNKEIEKNNIKLSLIIPIYSSQKSIPSLLID